MMRVAPQRLQENFSRAAGEYDARAQFQHSENHRVLDAAYEAFPLMAQVVDIGCGTGYFAANASNQRPGWRVTGIDIALGMCRIAAGRCTAINADARQLPLATASMDGVVSSLCYQWVEHSTDAYAELARVLKPGATAIIATLGAQTLIELRACAMKVDLPLALLPMRGFEVTATALEAAGLDIAFRERRVVVRHYANVAALMDSMRTIGAGNNFTRARTIGPKHWASLVAEYEKGRSDHGIPATWDHHFFTLRKPA